jgi:glutamyl-tRNA reductase
MAHLILSGFSYHRAPLAVRERYSVMEPEMSRALMTLKKKTCIEEVVVLSTCNRTEVYAVVTDVQEGFREIERFFSSFDHQNKPNFRLMYEDVALHLFRVASGLDSLIIGETQIVSQLKAAHRAALEANTAGRILNRMFDSALHCGKKVRSSTAIGRLSVSVSSAAIDLARRLLGTLKHKNVVVIGAGKMAQLCLKQLSKESTIGSITTINRNMEKVNKLADRCSDTSVSFDDRYRLVADADLVLVAASSPDYILRKVILEQLPPFRKNQILIIDISVPRNVEPSINEIPYINLVHMDDLAQAAGDPQERERLIAEAETIIFEQLAEFTNWQRTLHLVPVIVELRSKIESVRQEQLSRARIRNGESRGGSFEQDVDTVTRAIVNQLLHDSMVRMREHR